MTRPTRSTTTTAAAAVTTTVGLVLAAGAAALLTTAARSGVVRADAVAAAPRAATGPRTTVTLHVHGCAGCDLRLVQALSDPTRVWESRAGTVVDGVVDWRVPTRRAAGMSIVVDAPWDGGTGAVPAVVLAYPRHAVGDPVTLSQARRARRASGCFAGTAEPNLDLAIEVVHALVPGATGATVTSPRPFTTTTQPVRRPRYAAPHGILGTQDAVYCARR